MDAADLSDFLRRLTCGMAAEMLADESDRQLVERSLAAQDEAAFRAIIQRHGAMVYRVCRRVLQHSQDAEDAFQTTFLILARKLRTLRKHASLASWLHGVAYRVALKAKAQAAARRRHEYQAARPDILPPDEVSWRELCSALDFELNRLPKRWRLPLILCYLEGRTQDESARLLAWSKSTLRRRLQEARDALCRRLKGRGIVGSAALSAVLVSDCLASAAPTLGLIASTVDVAVEVAAGKKVATAASATVAALTEGVLRTMFLTKLKMVTALLFCISLVTVGVGKVSYTAVATAQVKSRPEAQAKKKQTPPEKIPNARLLLDKFRELDAAKERYRQAEAIFKKAQEKLAEAQQGYEEAQNKYESAKKRGRSKEGKMLTGTLIEAVAEKNRVRLEYLRELKGDDKPFTMIYSVGYENFSVAKDALILQDNVKTKLADLKKGGHATFKLDGQSVVRIVVDGGSVGGPIRYVSADAARNTIAVVAGKKDEMRIYHLVKETEVVTSSGKTGRLSDLKEGALLLLTRSAVDSNTVIRIEILSPDKEKDGK